MNEKIQNRIQEISLDAFEEYKEKAEFVQKIGAVCAESIKHLTSAKLDVFIDSQGALWEFLVVTYRGGAIAVRDCTVNSNIANLQELCRMSAGGYYDEVKFYTDLKEEEYVDVLSLNLEKEKQE